MVEQPAGLAIEATGLVKTYGKTRALDGLDLRVPAGTVYGLLGPNGAGKTTAVRVLATLARPTGGSASVFGHDVVDQADAVRGKVSLTGQFASVDEDLTGAENLILLARLLGHAKPAARARAEQLLQAFGLTEAAGRLVKKYSGGMRRRLDIAMGLVGEPRLVFLDEPTAGLDPRSRQAMWQTVRRLVADGVTVFLTTQYLEEADQLADRIAVLHEGRLVAEGTADELKRLVPGGHVTLRFADGPALRAAAVALDATDVDSAQLTLQVPGDGSVRSLRALLATLDEARAEVEALTVHTPDLDDVFLALTAKEPVR